MTQSKVFLRYEIEHDEKWREWSDKIPALKFPPDWEVKIIPPFAGAIVRFTVEGLVYNVSVYLDVYDRLGCYGKPYWEVYPYRDGCGRCDMENTVELLEMITETLSAGSDQGGTNDTN